MSLVVSLVLSRPDYGNATLAGLPDNQLDRLQSVMNAAARLVCSARKYEHITPLLRDLHWLRVPARTEFKLSVLVFRYLYGTAPSYLANELRRAADMDSRKRLRSASTSRLSRHHRVVRRLYWRSRVFRRWTARLEHCHPASLRLTLSTSKRRLNASFCHVIILTFSHPLSRDFFCCFICKVFLK